jgi:hypothetical protein
MVKMKLNVRFFIYDEEHDYELVEVDESKFLETKGIIEYERHTIFENGVAQICLTKNPLKG